MFKHFSALITASVVSLLLLSGCFSDEASKSTQAANSSQYDLSKSKGTDQDIIVSLTPAPAEQNVDASTKIEVVFSIPLDPSSVQKNNIKLTHLSSQTNDHVKGVISYNEETKTVTYTPDEALKPGIYEVEIKSLKPTKAYKEIHIKEIKYRFLVGGELVEPDPTPAITVLSPEANTTIAYKYITLEINATDTARLSAINQTLVQEQNRTIKVNGVDNNGTYYLYNVPLLQGSNEINIIATSEDNVSLSTLVNLTSEANGTAPIGMRAGSYEGVGFLQTTVEVGTLLNVSEYLFDNNGDGIIDEIHAAADSNFTVNYTQEGRYKPRVTIRTTEGPLYSSGNYVLSLDVKATADQIDPIGAEPLDVVKTFVQALIDGDREVIERATMNNERLISFIYQDELTRQMAAERAKYIDPNSWQQTYHPGGGATITAQIDEPQVGRYQIGFELSTTQFYGQSQGRFWFIRVLY